MNIGKIIIINNKIETTTITKIVNVIKVINVVIVENILEREIDIEID